MDALEAITIAGRGLRTVLIGYVDAKGQTTTRECEPYSLRPGKEGSIRFFGFDIGKSAIRGFRTDRINTAQVTDNTFVPKWVVEF